MISQSTIDEVKSKAKIQEVVADYFQLTKSGSGYSCKCPFHDDSTASFMIKVSDNFAKCFGCGIALDPVEFIIKNNKVTYQQAIEHLCNKYKVNFVMEQSNSRPSEKQYSKPTWKNTTEMADHWVKWFQDNRKISQSTLQKLKITSDIKWMPEAKYYLNGDKTKIKTRPQGERSVICFNYFRDDELINIKSRDSVKAMRLEKDCELIFYNLDSMKGAKEVYINEGEPDTASLVEAGIMKEGVAVISVPNGANIKSNNLTYLDSAIDLFEGIEKIHLATDNDTAGRKLREDLAERLGKERCDYIEWKDCKDANEVLVKYGINGVIECCAEKKEFPLEGSFPTSSFAEELKDLYHNGLDMGVGTGIEEFDKLLKFAKGYLTVVTGVSSHGKSSMLDQICILLNAKNNWKTAYYSPENRPSKLHISNIIRQFVGKRWFGKERLSETEMIHAVSYMEGKFWWIKPKKDFTLKSVLDHALVLKKRYGIDNIVLDSWNKFEHKLGKSAETQYISEQLDLLLNFCEANNIHCFLVAHPTKQLKIKNSINYEVPNLYSIAGSAAFFSKADNGICVYRDYVTGKTKVYVQKVRFSHMGEIGHLEFEYDKETGRFNVSAAGNVVKDYSNWITKENRQVVLDVPEIPSVQIVYDDGTPPPF